MDTGCNAHVKVVGSRVSMTMPSSLSSPLSTRSASMCRIPIRSDLTVQQIQPLRTSMISSSELNFSFEATSASSIEVSPNWQFQNSFSITAIFF